MVRNLDHYVSFVISSFQSLFSRHVFCKKHIASSKRVQFEYFSPEDSGEQMLGMEPEKMFTGANNVLTAICPRLKDFHSILVEPPKVMTFLCTVFFLYGLLTHYQTRSCRLLQTERVCRRQFHIWRKWKTFILTGRKHCAKRRNCSLRAISPFPTVFSKGLFPRGIKRCYCVVMG